MIARARRWPAEAAEMWSAIAADFAEATPLPPSETRFAVEDCDLPRGLATRMLDTPVDMDSLPAEVAKKSLGLARRGYFSRAVTALSAARVISAPTPAQTEAMRGLHPAPASPTLSPPPPLSPFGGAPTFSRKQVRKALHSFVLGSAAGMSGLSPKHLLDMAAYSGSSALDSIALIVARMAEGRVDESARRFMYGARLVALLKTDGGLRPIACGDVFRRMAAKLLCAAVADDARAHLKECGQLGVCVPESDR
jgi:hypothetical protein